MSKIEFSLMHCHGREGRPFPTVKYSTQRGALPLVLLREGNDRAFRLRDLPIFLSVAGKTNLSEVTAKDFKEMLVSIGQRVLDP